MAAIVFDLDDTIYPEREYVLSGFRAVAAWVEAHVGIPAKHGFDELKSLYERGVRGDTFNRWLVARGVDGDHLVDQLVRIYREHQPRIAPFPDVLALLHELRGRCYLGLVSDGYLAVQQRKLDALGVASLFDAVVFSDEWGREAWKPSRKPFDAIVARLGVRPENAIYVGDNPLKDFLGARGVGMRSVWLRRPGGEYADVVCPTAAHEPDWLVEGVDELRSYLVREGVIEA